MKSNRFIIFILSFIVTFKLFGLDVDYYNYVEILTNDKIPYINLEPFFIFFKILFKYFNNISIIIIIFYLFYSFISISIIVHVISHFSNYIFWSFLVYFSNFFFLHDYVQVRVAVSASLFLCSISFFEKNKSKYFLINAIGMFFHYSSILSISVFFFLNYFKRIQFYLVCLFLSVLMALLKFKSFSFLVDVPFFSLKLQKFILILNSRSPYNNLNLFNFNIIVHLIISLFLLVYYHTFQNNLFYKNLFKIYILSLCFYFSFTWLPVLSFRGYEFLSITEILLIPEILRAFKQKYFGIIILILIFTLRLINIFYINKLF